MWRQERGEYHHNNQMKKARKRLPHWVKEIYSRTGLLKNLTKPINHISASQAQKTMLHDFIELTSLPRNPNV